MRLLHKLHGECRGVETTELGPHDRVVRGRRLPAVGAELDRHGENTILLRPYPPRLAGRD
eukprot:COSAG01_NODE_663_length_14420_cov_77.011382_9_plen_60_part_00